MVRIPSAPSPGHIPHWQPNLHLQAKGLKLAIPKATSYSYRYRHFKRISNKIHRCWNSESV